MTSQVSQTGTGICAAATAVSDPPWFCTHMTCLGDKTLFHYEVSNVIGAIAAETEAHEALPIPVD